MSWLRMDKTSGRSALGMTTDWLMHDTVVAATLWFADCPRFISGAAVDFKRGFMDSTTREAARITCFACGTRGRWAIAQGGGMIDITSRY